MNFVERAINKEFKLTEIEDDFVDFIRSHKDEVSSMKVVTLANEFHTVPNTVTRFCHKLGYAGFSDLKAELRYELPDPVRVHTEQREMLETNFELIDKERESKISRLFAKSHSISFYGLGQTGLAAKICADNFYAIDDKFQFYTYPNELRHKIETGHRAIFFFISLSGESKEVVELAKLAKIHEHTVISLTNISNNNGFQEKTSLDQLSDISTFCYTNRKSVNLYDVTDKTPILLIMQSLYNTYRRQMHV